MSDVSYTRVNFENKPSNATPISAENLNVMDKGISDCATAINSANQSIGTKQPVIDNTLDTTSKTVPGAINELKSALTDRNTTYYNGKLYQLNADGTRGAEIPMGARDLDYANRQSITITNGTTMTVAKDGVIYTSTESAVNALYKILVNGYEVFSGGFGYIWGPSEKFPVKAGDVITHSGTMNSSSCFIHFVPYL